MNGVGMTKLVLGLLGGLYVGVKGEGELALSRKNRLVLATLALAGSTGLGREAVSHLLWGSSAQEQAQASLRQALSSIRKSLGNLADIVVADGENLRLDRTGAQIDVETFSDLLSSVSAAEREQALSLYVGDLLVGIPLKEGALEEWIQPLRERLRARAIDTLVGLLKESGPDGAIRLADQLLSLDPLNEVAHRKLMAVYAAQGRTSEAVKQFTTCRDMLARELGVPPSAETLRIYEQLRVAAPVESPPQTVTRSAPAETEARTFWHQKPSVVIQSFETLSDEPDHRYISRALTTDILSALSRHRWLSVSSGSSMADTGQYATVTGGRPTINAADYVVTGDVRSNGRRLRISVQLADGRTGEGIWSESYNSDAADVMEIQDNVVPMIAARLEPQVGARERQRVLWSIPNSFDAWDCYHRGVGNSYRFTAEANKEALANFEGCISVDPAFAEAHAWWAYATILSMVYYDEEPAKSKLDEALAAAQRAVELDEMSAFCHFALARIHLARRSYDLAFWSLETAIDYNPNMATAYCALGDSLAYQGRLEEAVMQFDKAIHLSPRDPMRWAYSGYCALAHIFMQDFDAAIRWSDDATRFAHCPYWAYSHKVSALGHLGRTGDASRAVTELRRRRPDFSTEFARRKLFFLERADQVELYLSGLRKAGLLES